MAEPMSILSPERLNATSNAMPIDDFDMTFHEPPSSPFVSHIDHNQENIAPTPSKPLLDFDDDMPQSAFKVSPEKKCGLQERASPPKTSPVKNLMSDFEEAALQSSTGSPASAKKSSPAKPATLERSESAMSSGSSKSQSPSKPRATSAESTQRLPVLESNAPEIPPTPSKRPSSSHKEPMLRDNEGPTVAVNYAEETHTESRETLTRQGPQDDDYELDLGMDNTDFNPDGPDLTSADIDDTCFSNFSEMPGLDMTNFAFLKQSPAKDGQPDTTPRARAQTIPSTILRTERTPSPTPRRAHKENDTTNLLLDFTAQIESFSSSRRTSPARGRTSPSKSTTEPNLRSYYQNQRSPTKGASHVPSTPSQSRQMFNLLDFELPPPPTPRSLPTVTIRELESVKSQFQSQVSSLTASLSGKEAEIDALSKAIGDAERRVGEALETVRDERSAREYAETQMVDWKVKGEEVQKLLQDVQSELARNDDEREELLARLADAERRTEEAENRSSDLETKVIEAESKNVDMTTFINNDETDENKKTYSEIECQAAIAEKVNEVARDLHTAYKAKHEKKIKALKDNYQKKADERCKELRLQIIRLERQVEEAEKKRDNAFSRITPGEYDARAENQTASPPKAAQHAEDAQKLEAQRAEIENLKAKLAGLQSELQSLRKSQDTLVEELEAERIEKGELVAAAEQMLSMCGEKMEELQQEDLRRSTMGATPPSMAPPQQQHAAPQQAMRNTGFLAGNSGPSRPGSALGGGRPGSAMSGRPGSAMGDRLGAMNERSGGGSGGGSSSGIAKPSGLRAPGGFGFQSGPSLSRTASGGKSRLLSNIERMGGTRAQE
ncbi:hypothetical protein EJ02DRAFT_499128 [Clathrospora elynae]|uniref:Uncharacterized protein n=1 Tax=Clathrospora elynae TaxID=706981 RepID=A0A6A5T888_9PLEO|nr:hypothetical protein EJ02DRAFT_499128 [Clathrospora elynae]